MLADGIVATPGGTGTSGRGGFGAVPWCRRCPVSSAKGLFRVAPSASKLKKLKAALDCCVVDVQEYSADPHAIAGGDLPGRVALGCPGPDLLVGGLPVSGNVEALRWGTGGMLPRAGASEVLALR